MHLYDAIEEYIFDHGKNFDSTIGQYDLLMPHELGRPLTHKEMDYNFLYQKQTMNGFRIFGSGTNLRLNDDDKDKVLKFHKIDPSDDNYADYTAAGYVTAQYIWIPEELAQPPVVSYISLTASPTVINETNNSTTTFTLQTINATDNTTVNWSIAGGSITANDIIGSLTGTATIVNNQATWTVQANADAITEGPEVFILTLASVDSAANDTTTYNGGIALNASVTITDTSFTPAYISLTSPGVVNEGSSITFTVNTQNFFQAAVVAWELDFTQSTANIADFTGPTSGTVNMTNTGTGSFSVTTATDLLVDSGEQFLVKLIGSDSNGVPTTGISTTATITDIAFPTYTTFTGPASAQEGDTVTYTLSGTTIPNATTVGYVISGVSLSDISLSNLTGTITMNSNTGTISFNILEDYIVESPETLTITLNGTDSGGNSTGLPMNVTTTISDVASTYSLAGPVNITEGTSGTYTFTATNMSAGTQVWYELRNYVGSSNYVDFSNDFTTARTGSGQVAQNGNFVQLQFDITAALDMLTEGTEKFKILVWDNASYYDTAGPDYDSSYGSTGLLASKNVNIIDLAPVYGISAASSQAEPSTLTASLNTQYVAAGTAYTWEVVPTGANPVAAADFVGGALPSGSGTIPVYNSSIAASDTFDISVLADNTTEGTENYKIVVTVAAQGVVAERSVDITDDSQTPAAIVYSMGVSPISIVENTTAQYMEFTVSTSQADNILPPAGTTVGYTISGDWSQQDISVIGIANSSPATLTGGMTNPYTGSFELDANGEGSIRVYGIYDQLVEGGEAVTVTLDAADSAGNATAGAGTTGTINDSAAQVWQINGAASQFEGGTFTFEVKTQNVPVQNFTWQVSGSSGTPASANDFNPSGFPSGSGAVSANHGSLTTDGTFSIEAAIDALVEYAPEQYQISLSDANGNLVDTHTVLIVDQTQTFDCGDAGLTVNDGLTGQTVTGVLTQGTLGGFPFSFSPSTYQSGNTSYSAAVTAPANDTNGNPYSNAGSNIYCSDTANGADITFALSNNGPVNEGGNITWTLTTANVTNGTTVPFTLSGNATSGTDYSVVTPYEFTVDNNTATYIVTTFADNLTDVNDPETVILTLGATDSESNATGSLVSTANINDTSTTPSSVWQVVPDSAPAVMDENGILADASQVFYIRARYVQPGTSYTWNVIGTTSPNGNAASAADFAGGVFPSGSGTWPASPGYTTSNQTDYNTPYTIIPFADQLTEPIEYYAIRLYDQDGILVHTYDQASIADTSQDPTYALTVNSPVNEGSAMTFTLQTTNHFSGDTIPFTLSGTATSGADYTNATTGQFTLTTVWSNSPTGVNEYSDTYNVTTIADATTEGSETITLTLDGIGTSITGTITDSSLSPYNYDCAAAALTVDDGTIGDAVTGDVLPYNGNASWGGTLVSFSPSTYQSGTTSYTALITAPTSDDQGISYANSGQNISCSANATGSAPAGQVYWYHLGTGVGANDYPFAANLITGTLYLADNTIAANYGESFTDMLANPSVYQAVNTQSGISDGDQFVFGTSNSANFFWIAIADSLGVPDLTTNARLADTNNNISDVAQAKLAFTHNGLAYTLYQVNLGSTANGVTIQYNV